MKLWILVCALVLRPRSALTKLTLPTNTLRNPQTVTTNLRFIQSLGCVLYCKESLFALHEYYIGASLGSLTLRGLGSRVLVGSLARGPLVGSLIEQRTGLKGCCSLLIILVAAVIKRLRALCQEN